jgi:hypothetical protein
MLDDLQIGNGAIGPITQLLLNRYGAETPGEML